MKVRAGCEVEDEPQPDSVFHHAVVCDLHTLLQQLDARDTPQRAMRPLHDVPRRGFETVGRSANQLAHLRNRHTPTSLVPASGRGYLTARHPCDHSETRIRVLDPLVFSSLWAAAVTPWLMYAAADANGFPLPAAAAVLGFAGTLVVYGLDRLRDLARDRVTKPARSAFVTRHAGSLRGMYSLAVPVGVIALVQLPPASWLPVGLAGGLGLFHRRLKGTPALEVAYVAFAWVTICIGLPVTAARGSLAAAVPSASVLALVLAANLVASNAAEPGVGPTRRLAAKAVALCTAGLVVCALPGAQTLWPIALFELLAVAGLAAGPTDTERYGPVVIDGALPVGAAVALWLG